jgi:S-adenosylmethionine hydrolase
MECLSYDSQCRLQGRNRWCGSVLHIDGLGNLVTNLQASDFPDLRGFVIKICGKRVTSRTYAEGRPGELFVISASTGYLEIFVNQGSAAELVDASLAAPQKSL